MVRPNSIARLKPSSSSFYYYILISFIVIKNAKHDALIKTYWNHSFFDFYSNWNSSVKMNIERKINANILFSDSKIEMTRQNNIYSILIDRHLDLFY